MTNKNMAYIAVLGVSAIGLVVDRVFLSEPDSAGAAQVSEAASSSTGSSASGERTGKARAPVDAALSKSSEAVDPTLGWLKDLPEQHTERDMFAASSSFLGINETEDAALKRRLSRGQMSAEQMGRTFEASHALQSTMIGRQENLAIIGGQIVRVGTVIDGFEVVRVGSSIVELYNKESDAHATLMLSIASH